MAKRNSKAAPWAKLAEHESDLIRQLAQMHTNAAGKMDVAAMVGAIKRR